MGSAQLSGVIPVLQTPFDEAGAVDEPTLEDEVDWVFECGADGVALAMVSEVLRLEHSERRSLAAAVCAAAASKGPVVVSVGAESTRVAVALAEHAQSVGAAALMAIPPLAVVATDRELEQYYSAIFAATDLPLVVQDASGYVGSAVPLSVLQRLQDRHGERVYFKPEAQPLGPRLSALLDATGGAARAFDGSGGVALVDSYRRGVVGSMPGAEVCWAIVRLWEALCRAEDDAVYRVSLPLAALLALQVGLDGYVAVEKYLLARQGIFTSQAQRGPVGFILDGQTMAQADRLLELLADACEWELTCERDRTSAARVP